MPEGKHALVTFSDECSDCGKDIQLTAPPRSEFVDNTHRWIRCSNCQHLNWVRKDSSQA